MSVREFAESPLEQGSDESIRYKFDMSRWPGSAYTNPVVVVFDISGRVPANWQDVTATVAPDAASITGSWFQTPAIGSLTARNQYRVECKWTVDGADVVEAYAIVNCTH